MMNRTYQSYKTIYDRMMEIFKEKSINFGMEVFVSDAEVSLVKFGDLFNPTHNLRCTFHFHHVSIKRHIICGISFALLIIGYNIIFVEPTR